MKTYRMILTVMILLFLPALAFAAWEVSGGSCGENVTWSLDSDGVLTISGEGDMYDYSPEYYEPWMEEGMSCGAPWRDGSESGITRVTVESGVTRIGEYAFYECTGLKSFSLAESVTSIGSGAFSYCSGLRTAVIPASVRKVESSAFSGCRRLADLTLKEGLQQIGTYAFYNTAVSSFTFPDSVTVTGAGMFSNCGSLRSIRLGSGITRLDESFLGNCDALETVSLSASVTSVSGGAFKGCPALTAIEVDGENPAYRTVGGILFTADGTELVCSPMGLIKERYTVPAGVKEIAAYAFYRAAGLKTVGLPDGLEIIGNDAFNGTGLTELNLPESVTRIGNNAFRSSALTELTLPGREIETGRAVFSGCTKLQTVRAGGGLKKIGAAMFSYCGALTDVVLEEGIEEVGNEAFSSCSRLTEITLPLSLRTVGNSAFSGCSALSGVAYAGSYEAWEDVRVGTGNDPLTAAMLKKYGIAGGDYQGIAWTLSDGVLTLTGSGAMPDGTSSALPPWCLYASSVRRAVIPEGITEIGNYAFRGCENLTEAVLPQALTRIGEYAFSGCSALKEIAIPSTVRSIGSGAFAGSALISAVIPRGVTVIEPSTFSGCEWLEKVTIPGTVTEIGNDAFSLCGSLEWILLPPSVRTLGESAFREAFSLKAIVLPEGMTVLDEKVFAGCWDLRTVTIPGRLAYIYLSAFEECGGLEGIYYAGTEEEWNNIAFYGDEMYMADDPLEGVPVYFGEYALNGGCGADVSWTLDAGGALILSGEGEMYDYASGEAPWADRADRITEILAGEGITRIGSHAFENCAGAERIRLPGTLTSVGSGAFDGCARLTEIVFDGTAGKWSLVSLADGAIPEGVRVIRTVPEQIRGLKAEPVDGALRISWTAIEEEETGDCRIFRRAEDEDAFSQKALVSGRENTEWTDTSVIPGKIYHYYAVGVNFASGREGAPCAVVPGLVPAAHEHVFGEWITDLEPTVYRAGRRYRECADCGEREEEEIPPLQMTEELAELYGEAAFRVVNAATKEPVSGASLIVRLNEEESLTLVTDGNGRAAQILPVGQLRVTAYAPGMLSRNLTVQITAGACEVPEIGLSDTDLLDAQITVKEMTYEEIVEAGIDPEAEGNEQVYKYSVELEFSPEIENLSLDYVLNLDGAMLDWNLPGISLDPGPGTDDAAPGWKPLREEEAQTSPDLPVPVRYEPAPGSLTEPITVYPVSEQFYLIVYGETRWLKEMFDVEMLVINRSLTDTLEDCVVTLELPEGLSAADMAGGAGTLTRSLGTVEGGATKSTHWYVRGDAEGDYGLTARLSAVSMPFGEEVDRTYTTQQYMHVFAGSALHVTYTIPDATYYNTDYLITAEIENVSDRTLYNISGMISGVGEYRISHRRDGDEVAAQYVGSTEKLNPAFAHEFRPGDKLMMEMRVPIGFDSEEAEAAKAATAEELRRLGALHNTLVTCKNLMNYASALEELLENAGKALIEGTATVIGKYRVFDNFLGFLNARADLFGEDSFNAYESLARVTELIPVRYSLAAQRVNVMEGSTTEIPTDFVIRPVVAKLTVLNPEMYRRALNTVIFGDLFELPSTGIFVFDWYADEKLKDTLGYDDAIRYMRLKEEESQAFKVLVPGKTNYLPGDREVTVTVWSEHGTLGLEAGGTDARTENGRLLVNGSCTLQVTPGSQDDTLYVEANGETREVRFSVTPAHTCSGVWLTAGYATEETDGLEIEVCETCRQIMGTRVTHTCGDHEFSEYETELEPTETRPGLQTRLCGKCHVLDFRLIDINGEEVSGLPKLLLSAERLDLKPGESARLFASFPEGTEAGELVWTSGDAETVRVDGTGVVTLLREGEATVSVKDAEGKFEKAVCTVRTDGLAALKLPAGLTRIEEEAMAGNGGVRCVDLRETGDTVIGERAFAGCENLIRILPAPGTTMERDAFSECGEAVCYCPDEAWVEKAREAGLPYALLVR